jgi:hypothetical protein
MVDASLEKLQAASQARYKLDLNGGLRRATGLNLDANGISQRLFGTDLNQNLEGLLAVLGGGLLLDGSSTSYAETPDVAALDILGDIEVSVEYAMTNVVVFNTIISKWVPTAQRSWLWQLVPIFASQGFNTSSTGANSVDQQISLAQYQRALKVTLDVDNGSAGRTARWYTGPSLDGPWTEQADSPVITAGTTTIFNSTAPLRIGTLGDGTNGFIGRIHRAEVRNGIGGTVVANPDFRNLAAGTTSFNDAAGRAWTLGANARVV